MHCRFDAAAAANSRAQTSDASLYLWLVMISGDMYPGVPTLLQHTHTTHNATQRTATAAIDDDHDVVRAGCHAWGEQAAAVRSGLLQALAWRECRSHARNRRTHAPAVDVHGRIDELREAKVCQNRLRVVRLGGVQNVLRLQVTADGAEWGTRARQGKADVEEAPAVTDSAAVTTMRRLHSQ